MAECSKEVIQVPVMVDKPVYKLELSEDEAMAFLTIANRTGGCPERSGRKHIDAMRHALSKYPELRVHKFDLRDDSASLYFA